MSVPQELIQKAMQGGAPPPSQMPGAGGPAAAAQAQPGAQPPGQSPAAAPMSSPQDKRGVKTAAHTNVHIAANMLEQALPAFGSESPEGMKVLQALKILGSLIGKKDSSDLVPAEILQMVKGLPQAGGGTAVQKQIMQMMQQQKPAPAPAP
jgi:hypothetical protein